MAKFGINDIVNAKSKAAGTSAVSEYTEIWLSPYDVKPSENNFFDGIINLLLDGTEKLCYILVCRYITDIS